MMDQSLLTLLVIASALVAGFAYWAQFPIAAFAF